MRARAVPPSGIPINQWKHYAATFTSNSRTAFFDGTVKNSTAGSYVLTALNSFIIGNRHGNRPFPGRLAGLAAWGRVLSDAEIQDLAQGASPLKYPNGLLHYWPGNVITKNSSTYLEDTIGNADALLSGGATWISDSPPIDSMTTTPTDTWAALSEGWFLGSTKYKYTGENIKISWTPHPDNIPWEGNYTFDLQVLFQQRNEIVIDLKQLEVLSHTFTLDRVGHYLARVRTCSAANPDECSAWSNSWSQRVTDLQVDTGTKENWWIFVWVGAPTSPGVE